MAIILVIFVPDFVENLQDLPFDFGIQLSSFIFSEGVGVHLLIGRFPSRNHIEPIRQLRANEALHIAAGPVILDLTLQVLLKLIIFFTVSNIVLEAEVVREVLRLVALENSDGLRVLVLHVDLHDHLYISAA